LRDIQYLNADHQFKLASGDQRKQISVSEIYIIDDEDFLRSSLTKFLSKIFPRYKVIGFSSPSSFISHLSTKDVVDPFILVTDMSFGDTEMDGIALVEYLRRIYQNSFYSIMMTGFGSIETAIRATKKGVYKYITKPFSLEDMRGIVSECLGDSLGLEGIDLKAKPDSSPKSKNEHKLVKIDDIDDSFEQHQFEEMIGKTPVMLELYEKIKKVSSSSTTVLILGESGTGKELVARAIHRLSDRGKFPIVNINCGAIPSEILESELFGHAKGAFTGAVNNRIGKFEASDGGSILLDEIGDMPLLLQVKLLRVLQTKTIEPIGSNVSKKINTRLIAATHKDIQSLVNEGKFREDLYYRLNVIPVTIPSLKERRGDIPMLIKFFVKKYISGNKTNLINFTKDAFDCLCRYDWPGNVRELENLIERLIILKGGNIIEVNDLPTQISKQNESKNKNTENLLPCEGVDLKTYLLDIERSLIKQALKKTNGNKNQASKLLGLNRTTLIEKIKKIDVENLSLR